MSDSSVIIARDTASQCRRVSLASTPSRYAIVRTHLSPPKLIAKTRFKTADVHYYIEHFLLPELGDALSQSIRILDFQEGEELAYTGSKRLDRVSTFSVSVDDEVGQPERVERRPALQSDGAGNLPATVAADRAFPAAVAELGR